MYLPQRSAVPGPAESLEQDWERLRDLLGGDEREKLRLLTERLSGLELQFAISQDRKKTARNSLHRIRPFLFGVLAIALLGTLNHLWQRSRIARAVATLEAVPGLVIVGNHTGSRTIKGLRDPLGPEPAAILAEAGIDASRFQLDFSSIASLETQWAEQRDRERARQAEATRQEFVTVVGDLDSTRESVRRRDLQSLTRALFHLKFPQAAGQAGIALENDQWKLRGTVDEKLYHKILAELPALELSGELDTSDFLIASPQALENLKAGIESITLTYLSGSVELSEDGRQQADRLFRLLRQHDDLSGRLGEMPAAIEVHSLPVMGGDSQANETLERARIAQARQLITEASGSSTFRLVPGVRDTEMQDGRVGVYVLLRPTTGSQP